jgi:hypothetical protein
MDQEERRERERDKPWVRLPERVHGDTESREHEIGREVFDVEQPGLPEAEPAGEAQHHGEQYVVDRDEHDACRQSGEREA